ncbi:MAG: type I pullulanase [Lactobacillus iners]|nr:type I pullulanase [Lactobacillus iners]MCT7775283.1 type I pullulanase [Lactobacillus iners]MCT7813407.1 type I pullulanase [Lactobacillus iners]MCT7829846.1 type I pullulanase [Lactobacillus iners]MCT7885150.1 type I pullulanase [Lactobacillus iners]
MNFKIDKKKITFLCTSTILGLVVSVSTVNADAVNNNIKNNNNVSLIKTSIDRSVDINQKTTKVIVHYQGDGNKWKLYTWVNNGTDKVDGKEYPWDGTDEYGNYKIIDMPGEHSKIGVLIKDSSWHKDGSNNDRQITTDLSGKAEVWYKEGSDQAQTVTPKFKKANIEINYLGSDAPASVKVKTDIEDKQADLSLKEDATKTMKQGTIELKATDNKEFSKVIINDNQQHEFTPLPGDKTDIYLVAGDKNVYYTASAAKKVIDHKKKAQQDSKLIEKLKKIAAKQEPVDFSKEQIVASTKVIVHYNGDASKWALWCWPFGKGGKQYSFDKEDDYGHYAEFNIDNSDKVGFLIKGQKDWSKDGKTKADRIINTDNSGKVEVWYATGKDEAQVVTPSFKDVKLKLHYFGDEAPQTMSVWADDKQASKQTIKLDKSETNGDKVGEITITGQGLHQINISNGKQVYKVTPSPKGQITDVYLNDLDNLPHYTEYSARKDFILSMANMDSDHVVKIKTNVQLSPDLVKQLLKAQNNEITKIEAINGTDNLSDTFKVTLKNSLELGVNSRIAFCGNPKAIDVRSYVRSKDFDDKYFYANDDLGSTYSKEKTTIKLWSPIATKVTLRLYKNLDNSSQPDKTIDLTCGDKGVWSTTLTDQDYKGWAYDYRLEFADGHVTTTDDPYSTATTINGVRSVIEDVDNIKPADFIKMPAFTKPTDAIIYEAGVRDLTADKNANVQHPGQFLGLTQEGTKTDTGYPTGLDYLKKLGVTHVQFLPMYDFGSIDEAHPSNAYNWGYDPVNYNVPEGSYSSKPADPAARILEMKEMINALHKQGLRVVMDVVYNHVYGLDKQAFDKVVPGYYFKYDDKGNMVDDISMGNAVASQRRMVRKYIVDSVKYWAKNYHIDGFRFDTMGVLDTDTMAEVYKEINKINPGTLIYGEGWEIKPNERPKEASYVHANLIPNVGFFGDNLRNAVIGESGSFGNARSGLAQGNLTDKDKNGVSHYQEDAAAFVKGFMGSQGFNKHNYLNPGQVINYSTCHDNLTLYDALKAHLPNASVAEFVKRAKLADSMIMLSQGVPLFHSGQEALRTKNGNANSYNADITVNEIDWKRVEQNKDLVSYFQKLVQLRKTCPAFRMSTYDEIKKNITPIVQGENGVFAFEIKSADSTMYVIFNVNEKANQFTSVDLTGSKILLSSDDTTVGAKTILPGLSTLVIKKVSDKDKINDLIAHLEADKIAFQQLRKDIMTEIENYIKDKKEPEIDLSKKVLDAIAHADIEKLTSYKLSDDVMKAVVEFKQGNKKLLVDMIADAIAHVNVDQLVSYKLDEATIQAIKQYQQGNKNDLRDIIAEAIKNYANEGGTAPYKLDNDVVNQIKADLETESDVESNTPQESVETVTVTEPEISQEILKDSNDQENTIVGVVNIQKDSTIFDSNGSATDNVLPAGSRWKIDRITEIGGMKFYRVGTNQYILIDTAKSDGVIFTKTEKPVIGVLYINQNVDLFDKDGHNTNILLNKGTYWKIWGAKVINGKLFYRVGTQKQWVAAESVKVVDNKAIKETPVTGVVKVHVNGHPDYQVAMLDDKGNYTGQFLIQGNSYKLVAKKIINGRLCYRLGTQKQWVPAEYLLF